MDLDNSWWNKTHERQVIKNAIQDNSGGGGGGSTPIYGCFYLTTGGITGISNSAQTLVINNTGEVSDAGDFTLSSNTVEVNNTGVYKISFDCYLNNSSTSRTEYSFWMEVNSSEVNGTRSASYQRGYDSGMSSSINTIQSLSDGDIIRFRVIRTDGGATVGYQDDNGTRLTIQKID